MQHILHFKLLDALVKIECDDNHIDMIFDHMAKLAAILIPDSEFDESKVVTLLHNGDALMHIIPN